MKLLSITLFAASISVPVTSFAECPSQLTVDDINECIMMEGSGDLNYQEWAPEFYKDTDPEKAAAVRAAYETETKNTDDEKIVILLEK